MTKFTGSGQAVLVRVAATHGSAPREEGAWMLVSADFVEGTIGGGHLELDAIAHARSLLRDADAARSRRYALGPSLGQCCGGVVDLAFDRIDDTALSRLQGEQGAAATPLALFGGGHVGKALVRVLAELPFRVRWIDSREEIFPAEVPANTECEHSDPVQAAVGDLQPGSRVLVMSFSHAEDLDVVASCLLRQRARSDLPYVGLIGSRTKWATFRHRLQARGFSDAELAHVTCPIGVAGIGGKQPAVVAVAVAAQLLQLRSE